MFTVVTCSPTLNIYCDIISGHAHKQLRVYQYNKLDMRNFCKQNFTIVSTPLRFISSGSILPLSSGNISVGAEDRTVTITELTPGLKYDITLVALSGYLPSPAATVTLGESSVYVARNFHGPKFSRIGH